jgi:hypothetical protein
MFCPDCGVEDRQANQFCRSCGTDLRRVRNASLALDQVTAASISAREEIGRAIAAKVGEVRSPADLAVLAEDVLPEIEKFLESPEEKRLRRLRTGMIISGVGIGTAVGLSLAALAKGENDFFFLAGLGVVAFFLGVAFMLNGVFLTVPRDNALGGATDAEPSPLGGAFGGAGINAPAASEAFGSVTEGTTRQLDEQRNNIR